MNNKFNFVKFILDCFVCFGVMLSSIIIFSYPFAFIVTMILNFILGIDHFSVKVWCFGDMSAILLPSSLVVPIIIAFLGRKNIINYKFYKMSLMACFMLLAFFVFFIDYTLNCNFIK